MQSDPPTAAPLTVLGVVAEPFDGVGYVRFGVPFAGLASRGVRLRTLGRQIELRREGALLRPAPSALDGVSLVVFPQLVASPVLADGSRVDLVGGLCDEAARRGVPVVYSVDDYLPATTTDNPNHARITSALDNLSTIRRHASAVIATTATLARAFADWNVPTHILPNTIDPRCWQPRPRRGRRPTIGWAGSSTHLEDLLQIAPTLVELRRRVPFRFVLYGLTDLPLDAQRAAIRAERAGFDSAQRDRATAFERLHDLLRTLDAEHVPFGTVADYTRRLPELDLDIGLCPLLDTPFNRCKSALKFYEYAACETLCVASDVPPYRGEVSQLAGNTAAWAERLERFLLDPGERDLEQARQRAWVLDERTVDRWVDRWNDTLRGLISQRAPTTKTRVTHVAH